MKHPMQTIEYVNGVIRFRRNPIVDFVISNGSIDLNEIAKLSARGMPWTDDDHMQLAMLIGYSVSGFGELSYASRDVVRRADRKAEKLYKECQTVDADQD